MFQKHLSKQSCREQKVSRLVPVEPSLPRHRVRYRHAEYMMRRSEAWRIAWMLNRRSNSVAEGCVDHCSRLGEFSYFRWYGIFSVPISAIMLVVSHCALLATVSRDNWLRYCSVRQLHHAVSSSKPSSSFSAPADRGAMALARIEKNIIQKRNKNTAPNNVQRFFTSWSEDELPRAISESRFIEFVFCWRANRIAACWDALRFIAAADGDESCANGLLSAELYYKVNPFNRWDLGLYF